MLTLDRAEDAIRRETDWDGPFPAIRVYFDVDSSHGEWSYSDRDTVAEAEAEVTECEPQHGAYWQYVSGPCWPVNAN